MSEEKNKTNETIKEVLKTVLQALEANSPEEQERISRMETAEHILILILLGKYLQYSGMSLSQVNPETFVDDLFRSAQGTSQVFENRHVDPESIGKLSKDIRKLIDERIKSNKMY